MCVQLIKLKAKCMFSNNKVKLQILLINFKCAKSPIYIFHYTTQFTKRMEKVTQFEK